VAPALVEAVGPESFYERVQKLEQGEVARLKGGVAIKRVALEDGRDAYRVGSPSSYGGRGEPDFHGEAHRSAEDAVKRAFAESARSADPDSIGGTTRMASYSPVEYGGVEHRIRDWTVDGKAVVASVKTPGVRAVVAPAALRRTALLEGMLGEEVGKPGTNWKQVAPGDRKKVDPLVRHWMKHAHPWQACVNALTPKKGAEAAKRICSVVKDMGERSTKWRKGGKRVQEEIVEEFSARLIEAADGDVEIVEWYLLTDIAEHELGEEWSDASRAAALAKRKALHPDWNWGGKKAGSVVPGDRMKIGGEPRRILSARTDEDGVAHIKVEGLPRTIKLGKDTVLNVGQRVHSPAAKKAELGNAGGPSVTVPQAFRAVVKGKETDVRKMSNPALLAIVNSKGNPGKAAANAELSRRRNSQGFL
jgi:hypothetical protein